MKKLFIRHRVNKIEEVKALAPQYGAEIDLRSDLNSTGKIYLAHDPWTPGDDFETWLSEYSKVSRSAPLILNTKEDGLEARSIELLKKYKISNYFFLDTAGPTLIRKTLFENDSNFAVRFSAYETLEQIEKFKGKAQWVWVDCFQGKPVDAAALTLLHKNFKICLVSPELQKAPIESINQFKKLIEEADAVCTKNPEAWIKEFSL